MADGSVAPRITAITPATWDEAGWNRAWDAGLAEGLRSALIAVVFIDRASEVLSKLPRRTREAIWQQANHDVLAEHGDLPDVIRRSLAARRIVRIARER